MGTRAHATDRVCPGRRGAGTASLVRATRAHSPRLMNLIAGHGAGGGRRGRHGRAAAVVQFAETWKTSLPGTTAPCPASHWVIREITENAHTPAVRYGHGIEPGAMAVLAPGMAR